MSELEDAIKNGSVIPFNEDDIRRSGLPRDVFGLLHELAYHHEFRNDWERVSGYVRRAQHLLKANRDGLAAEREACAKIAEGYATLHIESHPCHIQAKKTAAKIRARKDF